MPTIPANLTRTSTAFAGELLLRNLRRTNVELLRLQEQLSTNKTVNRPSDAPQSISKITSLNTILAQYTQRLADLGHAGGISDVTDQALADVTEQLAQAKSIAASQVGVGATAQTRASEAEVISGILDSLLQIGNRSFDNVFLFSGEKASTAPFEDALGGIRYVGSRYNLLNDATGPFPLEVNSNGDEALGALSARVKSTVDLNPTATANTRLANLRGARNSGINRSPIQIDIDGTVVEVDLTHADTLGDITTRINSAINGVDASAGSIAVTSAGLTLTAAAGHTVSISDVNGGKAAADLGIVITAASGSVAGADVNPKLTMLTALSQLGVSVNLAGGLKITNGGITRVVDTSAAVTVEDLINTVNNAGLGVRLEINEAATSFNLVNEVSGVRLTIGENAGGTTATDLGLRSLDTSTLLSDFNHGSGVRNVAGQADFRITLGSGATFDIDLDGATTVQDVLDAINTAGGGALTAGLAADGNGIVLNDLSGVSGTFSVTALNGSLAAQDLGIYKNAGAGTTITGDDNAGIQSESIFTHLIQLRDALAGNDERMITVAASALDEDLQRIALVRARMGVRGARIENEKTRIENQQIQAKEMLSDLQDTDVTQAISRFSLLQQQLQASLQTSSMLMKLNLMDFLR